jgi:transposase
MRFYNQQHKFYCGIDLHARNWIADFCTEHKIPFVLGHALYMKAIQGGKTKNDKIDSYKIAKLLRGGNLPMAYPYPAKMRATRDLLRRRIYMVRQCGLLVAHIQNTNTQYNLPAFNKNLTRKYNHDGVAERFDDPSVRAAVEADLAMVEAFNKLLKPLEWQIEKIACEHDPNNLYLLSIC